MLKNMNDGLLIDLIGASDGAIGLTGDFSRTIVLAYQIKRGRVAGYVRGASVSGDLYRSLQNIEALSCDGYWSDDIFTPYIQLGEYDYRLRRRTRFAVILVDFDRMALRTRPVCENSAVCSGRGEELSPRPSRCMTQVSDLSNGSFVVELI